MPPAGAKKGSAKKSNNAAAQPFNKNWEAGLVKAQFDEDSWQACVSLVVGDGPEEEEELIQPLVLALQQPPRKLFTLITWKSTLSKIQELGNPKSKRPDDLPMFYEVTEAAKMLLDAGEEIPCDLLAKMLKFQLLEVKTCDEQRREAERLESEGQKEKVLPHSDSKAKLSDKKGKGPPSALEPSKEKKTKLKRRDDVEPPIYIDDEPVGGPQHYILLAGLHQPHLVGALDAVGVHVANVIKLCSKCEESIPEHKEQNRQEVELSLQASPEVPGNASKLHLFWSHLRSVLDSGPPDSKLHDVIQLSYTVPDLTLPVQTQDPQTVVQLGSQIFDGVARLIYDSLEWRRQYRHYRDNVQLISIPTAVTVDSQPAEVVLAVTPRSKKRPVREQIPQSPETKLLPLSMSVDMCYYSSLLDLVPPEACSVPLILHCMLEQVGISTEQPLPAVSDIPVEQNPDSGPWLDCDLVSYMLQSFLPLLSTEEERRRLLDQVLTTVQKEGDRKRLLEEFGTEHAQRKPDQPLIIRHHDERARRLQDVTVVHGFNPAEVESSMMKCCPVFQLIQSVAEQRNSDSCWKAVKQQLQHHCTDESVSWPEVERLFRQSVFEAMTLTTVDQQGVLLTDAHSELAHQQTQRVIPWDNPLLYAKQKLQSLQTKSPTFLTEDPCNTEHPSAKLCCHLDLSELQSCRQRSLFGWHYTEHHNATVFPQVLKMASEEYCCLDIFRGTYENIIYVFCHNPMNTQRLSKKFWDVTLHTDVKFRKYLEHVADKITTWTKEEELKREERQIKNQSSAGTPNDENPESSIAEEEAPEPVIRADSLKAWKIEEEQLKKEETTKKSKKNTPKGNQKKEEVQTSDTKSKALSSDKRNRADKDGGSTKIPTDPDVTTAPAEDETTDLHLMEEPDNRFIGYAMDGRLIHVSGCVQEIYPSDGGHITVENLNFVEGSTLIKVAVKKDGHYFHTHVNQVVSSPLKTPSEPQDKKTMDLKEGWTEPESMLMKAVKLGSFSAVLSSQIHLSYSFYGPTGECKESFEKSKEEITKISTQEPTAVSSSNSQGFKGQSAQPSPPFKSLSLSFPNGLLLQFLHDDTQGVLVRQSFPLHGKGSGHHLQDSSLSKERYRIFTGQGALIRYMRDGSTEVLFADGSVSFRPDSGTVARDAKADEEKTDQTSQEEAEPHGGFWQTTSPSGNRVCTTGPTPLPDPSIHTVKATDPITHQVMLIREDLVVIVQNPDGSLVVEHADGTRITTLLLPNGEAPNCVTKSQQSGTLKAACDKGEGMGRNSTSQNLNERALNKSEEGRESTKERAVLVEKEGCASVVMYPDRHTAHVLLADGTIITGSNQADYEVFPSGGGFLHIQSDGKCVYSSDLEPRGCSPADQPGVYTMSHTDRVACDVTDNNGNRFQVMDDGKVLLLNSSPTPGPLTQAEEEETDGALSTVHVKHKHLCPRLFLVHEDGSGTEMLNSQTVEELLDEAYSDLTVALLNEPLPGKQDEFSITILKPGHHSVWSQWLINKQNPDITPPNLRNRSWNDFPTAVNKQLGSPFGTNAGVGLTLKKRCSSSASPQQRVRSCPKVLEIRELYQHRPFNTQLRNALDSRLKECIESFMTRELQSEEMKLKEPRSEEEIARATDLLSLILSFAEEEAVSQAADTRTAGGKNTSAPVDYARLYGQGVRPSAEQSEALEDTDMDADDLLDKSALSTDRTGSIWSGRLKQHREEILEEKAWREALRKKIAVNYFHPENVTIYQSLVQGEIPNSRSRSQDQPLITNCDSAEAEAKDASNQTTNQPLHATPSQSESRAAEIERMPERRHPNLPTQPAGESSLRNSSRRYKSVQLDVMGKPRRTNVRLPGSLHGAKPCSVPNRHFLTVEEPVRRKCCTASLADPSAVLRGFQLNPASVDFGTQQEGTYSTVSVLMKNVGVNSRRFSVKQPPPATGLRVLYNRGPVAAGLQVELRVQLFAMCDKAEPKKFVSQDITILTETDIIYLPVTAVILSERICVEASLVGCRAGGSHSWPGRDVSEPSAP